MALVHALLYALPQVLLIWAIGYAIFFRRKGQTARWPTIMMHVIATTAAATAIQVSAPGDSGAPLFIAAAILVSLWILRFSVRPALPKR